MGSLSSILFFFLVGSASPASIVDLRLFENCNNCHTGALAFSVDQAFSVQDPDNGFEPVEEYIPGETYRLRIRFNPTASGGRYRVAYRVGAFGRNGSKKGELATPNIGDFEFGDGDAYLGNVIDTTTLAEAQDAYVSWTAPEDGFDVVFFVARVETNRDDLQGGDRGSANESIVLAGPNGNGGADGSDDGSDGSGSGGNTSGGGTDSGGSSGGASESNFSGSFSAGCSLSEKSGSFGFWLTSLSALLLFVFSLRRRSEKNS